MTMYKLPNFCRVCLKYDKNLIDLARVENEPNETLLSKLQHCVSEVEWSAFRPLMCHPCIKRLNIAYSFKKQCMQSASVLKNYVELVRESQQKKESQNQNSHSVSGSGGAYMLLPNQKYVKIVVGAQNQGVQTTNNTFQNVFLNLIPSSNTVNPAPPAHVTPTPNLATSNTAPINSSSKDTNQNVFLSLNNTFQKFIPSLVPMTPTEPPKPKISSVTGLPIVGSSEEVSVEVDPIIYGLNDDLDESFNNEMNDYDEVISQAKIALKDINANGESMQNGKDNQKLVPILPKSQDDFFTSGQHFLFSSLENGEVFPCEHCQKTFTTKKLLKVHINQLHLGKMPFKCEYCYAEFLTRAEYNSCIRGHHEDGDAFSQSITLQDLANDYQPPLTLADVEANMQVTESGEFACDVCGKMFNSPTGLLRHKVRKHNQKTRKKKYFIKGMKNAKCDICGRDFSTQSYMQLHRKLHMRDDVGYKYKVFGKSRYNVKDEKDEKDTETYEKRNDELQEKHNNDGDKCSRMDEDDRENTDSDDNGDNSHHQDHHSENSEQCRDS